jgi:hypothetical protein
MAYVIKMDVHNGQTRETLDNSECLTVAGAEKSIDDLVNNLGWNRDSLHIVEDNDPITVAAAECNA